MKEVSITADIISLLAQSRSLCRRLVSAFQAEMEGDGMGTYHALLDAEAEAKHIGADLEAARFNLNRRATFHSVEGKAS